MRAEQMELILMLFQCWTRSTCLVLYGRFWSPYNLVFLELWNYIHIYKLVIITCNNQRDTYALFNFLQLINKQTLWWTCHRLLQLLVSRGSCSAPDGHLWPSVTSWLQPSTAGQSLGITGGTGGQVVSLCGTFLQSFLYICLQLRFKIAPRGLARGFGRCGRNGTNNLVEPVLNAGNFSQASWKTEVLSWIYFLS